MAKRYHQSKKDRMHERRGEERHIERKAKDRRDERRGEERYLERKYRSMGEEYYAGMDPRRRQELEDAGMIHEDHGAVANLPQAPKMVFYPKTGPYIPEDLDDTIRGVDGQMDYDNDKRRAHFYPKKV